MKWGKEIESEDEKTASYRSMDFIRNISGSALLFPVLLRNDGERTYSERSYHYNLMPLKEIKRFIIYRKALGAKAVCFNLLGNIVAFIPYGMLLPLLAHNQRKFYRVVLLSFDFSLLVELVQLVSKVGSFDVDDLILNTIGGAIGYVGFLLANHIRCHKFEQKE